MTLKWEIMSYLGDIYRHSGKLCSIELLTQTAGVLRNLHECNPRFRECHGDSQGPIQSRDLCASCLSIFQEISTPALCIRTLMVLPLYKFPAEITILGSILIPAANTKWHAKAVLRGCRENRALEVYEYIESGKQLWCAFRWVDGKRAARLRRICCNAAEISVTVN